MSIKKCHLLIFSMVISLTSLPILGYGVHHNIHAVISSEKMATISSPMNGYIEKLNIKDGVYFKKGQVLLEFDCRLQLAEQKKATAEVKLAKINKDSQQRLNQLGSASKIKLVEANAKYEQALAELDIASKRASDCNITAPFDGQVTELYVHQHETIKLNQQVFSILNNDDITVRLLVPSSWLSKINIGTRFDLTIKETNKNYQAKVIRISNQVDAVSRSIKVIATVLNKDPDLKSGMSGYAFFKVTTDEQ